MKKHTERSVFLSLDDLNGYQELKKEIMDEWDTCYLSEDGIYIPVSSSEKGVDYIKNVKETVKLQLMECMYNDLMFISGAGFMVKYNNRETDDYNDFFDDLNRIKKDKELTITLWLMSNFKTSELSCAYEVIVDNPFFDTIIIYDTKKYGFRLEKDKIQTNPDLLTNPSDFQI